MISKGIKNNHSSDVKLSVAIPTYNGAKYIREALDSIITQLDDIDEKIEIVISDNASTDNTYDIVKEYQKKYPHFITYYKNDENLGPDRNYDLAVRKAKGKFVWLFSDDDKIRDGGIKKALDVINKYPNIAAIFMNYESLLPLNCNQDCLCSNGNDFFNKTSFKNGLVSSNIIKKSIWESIDTSKYFYTNWIHFGVLIEALSKSSGFIVSHPFVGRILKIGTIRPRWGEKGSFIYVGFRLVKIFKNMNKYDYKKDTITKGIFVVKRGYLKSIPLAKIAGLKVDFKLIKEFFSLYKSFPSFWITDLPLLLVPSIFYKAVYKIGYRLSKIERFKKVFRKLISKMP